MNSQFGDENDVLDVVALAGIDEPPLQAFRNSNPFDEDSYKVTVAPAATNQLEINEPPLQLLRRASETVTSHILADLEPEKQHLLAGAEKRPLPPPRGHGFLKAQQDQSSVNYNGAKRNRQQQPDNKALGPGDKMMQESNVPLPTLALSPPLHTKLDIQKFPEDFNNGQTASGAEDGTANGIGGGGGGGGDGGDAATIILTPTSLNLTNVARNGGGGGGGGGGPTSAGEPRHSDEYKGPKWWRHLVLHWSLISEHVSLLVIFLGLWSMAWVLLPDYAQPQAVIMRIAFLFVGAQISGILVTFVHLPDMLGMLFFGVLYTNLGLANFEGYQRFELFLREMALINIMLLAGLGLDGDAFKRLWFMILRLTLLPTIVEVAVIAGLAYLTLSMPWLWGIALGLVITAVSPNVVVTVMLKLKEDRLGLNSGIHTLIYAMTTCNDVVAIFMFGVIISVIFSTSSLTQQVLQGPIGIGIGLVFGYLYGMMLQYLPSRNAVYANGLRFVLTILGGTIAVMGSRVIGYTSAGALGCVTTAFIARIGWKREESKLSPQQLQAHQISSVPKRLDLMWKFLKPVSFALIGKEINFAVLEGHVIGFGALLVLLGSLLRLAFAYLSTYGGNLSRKERAYITISGFPKATVQAALGPVALDLARAASVANETQLSLASNVLIISVLAIIFTAPLGAILMLRLAPYWLKHGDAVEEATTPTTPVVNPTTLSISNANKTA